MRSLPPLTEETHDRIFQLVMLVETTPLFRHTIRQSMLTYEKRTSLAFLALCIFAVSGGAGIVVQTTAFRLSDGQLVEGKFNRKPEGLFLRSKHGGKLYRWHELDAQGLPRPLRDDVRQQVIDWLQEAQAHYDRGEIPQAQRLFRHAYSARGFLEIEDWERPELENIGNKARGYVLHENRWIPFERRQEVVGLAQHRGRWLPVEEVKELKAFEQAIGTARKIQRLAQPSRVDYQNAIIGIREVLEVYPESKFRRIAEQEIADLLRKFDREAYAQAPSALRRPPLLPQVPTAHLEPIADVADNATDYYGNSSNYPPNSQYVPSFLLTPNPEPTDEFRIGNESDVPLSERGPEFLIGNDSEEKFSEKGPAFLIDGNNTKMSQRGPKWRLGKVKKE